MTTMWPFVLGLFLVSAATVRAQFDYSTNGDMITLTGYSGSGGDVTIPNFVTSIGADAFEHCASLINVTIPNTVNNIGEAAFYNCTSLHGVYFLGNAPPSGADVFLNDDSAKAYYLPGTKGWGKTFDSIPTALWTLPNPMILNNSVNVGVPSSGFSFTVFWASNATVIVEASTSLAVQDWQPLQTNTIVATSGTFNFGDSNWTNYPSRFYRIVVQ